MPFALSWVVEVCAVFEYTDGRTVVSVIRAGIHRLSSIAGNQC
jgi:hypothetical protein